MIKFECIGNVTHTPEAKRVHTAAGEMAVCTFTVAASGRGKADNPQFFMVTAWRQLAETCARYLEKGRKVYVCGYISARAYSSRDGEPRASLEVTANEVEFLSPKNVAPVEAGASATPAGMEPVGSDDDLPF